MKKSAEASRQRFRMLAPVEFDPKDFLPSDTGFEEVRSLLEAADIAHDLFWRQVSPEAGVSRLLELAPEDAELQEMILFHRGPYDRLGDDSAFLPVDSKPPGAGFYPEDLSREEFTEYVRNHPDCKSSFESPYTVIKRTEGTRLAAVPYHEAYGELVNSLSRRIAEASRTKGHQGFLAFLAQKAKDVLTDDYHASDSMWVRLVDNPLDFVIGPYEVYEDQLLGLKAAYEAMILGRDLAESSKVGRFQSELPSLCRNVEQRVGKRFSIEDSRVALSVANLIYSGGDARKAIPAIAFSLPNDERIIEDVGSRQVILRNVLEAKFRLVDWRLHNRLLQTPVEDDQLAFRFFFDHTLFHEISHSIGPHRITVNGEPTTVNRALKQHYSVIEETKADALAACFVLHTADESDAGAFLKTYVSGFLRAIRFGMSTAHGGANAVQLNFLMRGGAIAIDPKSGRLLVDPQKACNSLIDLVSDIIGIQERGDFQAANRFLGDFCVASDEIAQLEERASDLPVDIRIRFKNGRDRHLIEQHFDRALVR